MSANPYAAPTTGLPDHTWWSLWAMGSRFAVGAHTIEVDTWHWTGLTVARVDGQEVHRERNLGWHALLMLEAGRHKVDVVTRWYPLQPVRVDVDGMPYLDDLFPQVAWLKIIGVAAAAPLALAFSASIAYDMWRMLLLAQAMPTH